MNIFEWKYNSMQCTNDHNNSRQRIAFISCQRIDIMLRSISFSLMLSSLHIQDLFEVEYREVSGS